MLTCCAFLSLLSPPTGTVPADDSHAELHPAQAQFFMEVPAIDALWAEFSRLPLMKLALGEESSAWIGELLERDGPFDLVEEIDRAVREGELHADGAGPMVWHMVQAATGLSFSVSGVQLDSQELWENIGKGQLAIDGIGKLSDAIADYAVQNDHLPPSLEAISTADKAMMVDPWGNAFLYEPGGGFDFDLSSLGADGAPGGVFGNQDLRADTGERVLMAALSGIDLRLVFDFDDEVLAGTAMGFLEMAADSPEVRVGVSPHDGLLLTSPHAPGLELHALQGGGRILLDLRAADAGSSAPHLERTEHSLVGNEGYRAVLGHLGEPRGATVWHGYLAISALELTRFLGRLEGEERDATEERVQDALFEALDLGAGTTWRTQIDDGRLYRDAVTPARGSRLSIDTRFVTTLPAHAIAAGVVVFDADGILAGLLELGGEAMDGTTPDEWIARGEEMTGVNLGRDLIEPLGSTATVFLESLVAIGLPPVRAYVQLDDAERFSSAMSKLAAFANEHLTGALQIQEQTYRGVKLFNFAFEELQDMGPFVPRPSIAVLDDRLIVSLSSIHAKRDIKRLDAETESGDRELHPLAQRVAEMEGEFESLAYMDWSALIKGGYGVGRAALGMFGGLMGDLPFDPSELPAADDLMDDFPPAMRFTRVHDGIVRSFGETSVGPEVFVLPGLAATLVVPAVIQQMEGGDSAGTDEGADTPDEDGDEARAERTVGSLQLLRTGLAVYKLDRGGYPETLAALEQGSDAFPDGYLQGSSLPTDGWERPFIYRPGEASYFLYSAGADGRDDGGGGDDLVAD